MCLSSSLYYIGTKVLDMFLPFANSAWISVQSIPCLPDVPERLICKLADSWIRERCVPQSVDIKKQFQMSLPMYIEGTGRPEVDKYGTSEDDPTAVVL